MLKRSLNLVALLAGGAVGATMGVLMAPDKGEETRKKLSDNLKLSANQANAKVDDLKRKAQGFVNRQEQDFESNFNSLVQKADHKKDQVIEVLERKLQELKNTNLTDKLAQKHSDKTVNNLTTDQNKPTI